MAEKELGWKASEKCGNKIKSTGRMLWITI
jgi:hypothetical protein